MSKKEKAKALWELCFNDNPKFTDLYFKKRYTDENTLAIMDGDKMISSMQLLSYPFQFLGEIEQSAYVSGACTHPDYRGKGVMTDLLKNSFKHLYNHNIPLCTLIPAEDWLFDYYQKSGFETVFYNTSYEVDVPIYNNDSNVIVTSNDQFNREAFEYLHHKLMQKSASVLHTKEDYEVILADLNLAKGKVFTAHIKNKVVGLALAYLDPTTKKVQVNELLSRDICINQELFIAISKYFETTHIIVKSAAFNEHKNKLGMLRIIKLKPILDKFAQAQPEKQYEVYVTDKTIPQNQGYYLIEKGKVEFKDHKCSKDFKVITINELTRKLFNPLKPYMSLMLD